MPLVCRCDCCGQRIQVSSRLLGKRIVCPHCKQATTVADAAHSVRPSSPGTAEHSESSVILDNLPGEAASSPQSSSVGVSSDIPSVRGPLPEAVRENPVSERTTSAVSAPSPPPLDSSTPSGEWQPPPQTGRMPPEPPPRAFGVYASHGVPSSRLQETGSEPETLARNAAGPPPSHGLVVPVSVVVMQGILLAVMAVAGVTTGWLAAGRSPLLMPQPCFLTGKILLSNPDGTTRPGEGALVVLFPEQDRPERSGRIPAGLFLQHGPNAAGNPSSDQLLDRLRQLGGDLCRVEEAGFYYVRARQPGTYFVLYLAPSTRNDAAPLDRQVLAELGRYVDRPHELLGPRRFRWQRIELRGDRRLDITVTD
jgi:hypothetical protein